MRDLAILLCFSHLLVPPVQCAFESLTFALEDASVTWNLAMSLVERDLARSAGKRAATSASRARSPLPLWR